MRALHLLRELTKSSNLTKRERKRSSIIQPKLKRMGITLREFKDDNVELVEIKTKK